MTKAMLAAVLTSWLSEDRSDTLSEVSPNADVITSLQAPPKVMVRGNQVAVGLAVTTRFELDSLLVEGFSIQPRCAIRGESSYRGMLRFEIDRGTEHPELSWVSADPPLLDAWPDTTTPCTSGRMLEALAKRFLTESFVRERVVASLNRAIRESTE
ncbi:MAG: hypothetical protein KTR31_16335 [Myxococcales bacterium]|nr:hypothetical protein [Myxococcales bacterium]